MKNSRTIQFVAAFVLLAIFLSSCTNTTKKPIDHKAAQEQNELLFTKTLQTHLIALENKNLDSLKSTLSPIGEMQLILPDSKIKNTVDEFVALHQEWFKDTTWTIETKIANIKVGDKIGMAVTEAMYREPNRNGSPYFNHMMVSYDLEKIDNKWYVIKDHASSIEKTKSKATATE
ncbi:SnoaL-like protein [Aquimarina sp. MAR_2010_214]|uniref:nuclear transport factor 2 family protein n=1 Tax=Aquimarina sp. MAR_2010_214 TaxID=1250026 RepID=UPI000C6FE0AF|nr:nuclear transport factor 2 family protein [Aquimarina sp. MAR_2010_214]PKV48888.1 SnoaL-like protein [Aquimarina sp. MAR_2010_214]